MTKEFDDRLHYSFKWNTSVYTLRKLGVMWVWVSLFDPTRYASSLEDRHLSGEAAIEHYSSTRRSMEHHLGELQIHRRFTDVLTHWANVSGVGLD